MRVALFDWNSGGHHAAYVQRFADALQPDIDVVAAVSDEIADAVEPAGVEVLRLGPARPREDMSQPLRPQFKALAARELALLDAAIEQSGADHLIHLNADPVLRALVRHPRFAIPVTPYFLRSRAHWPSAYGAPLTVKERLQARFHDLLVQRWRRRPDAYATLALEEEAARRWTRRPGAPAHWIPEPPVSDPPAGSGAADREGMVLFGALAPQKGIDLLAGAVSTEPTSLRITLAGSIEPGFEPTLQSCAERMRAAGNSVNVAGRWIPEAEGLEMLAGARCVALPYPRHFGMSRVLLEAASVGTPLVVHDFGLLGHLVRENGLGRAVDCRDPRAFRAALVDLVSDPRARAAHAPALAAFAERYSDAAFARAVRAPFAGARTAVDPAPAR